MPALAALALVLTAPATAAELRVLTYNVWGLPEPMTTRPGRFLELQKRLPETGADVIAFQETFTTNSHVLAQLPEYPHRAWGPQATRWHSSSGLLVVSRYPIVETHTLTYAACTGIDCWANKGALHVRLQVGDVQVDVFDTHLNAGSGRKAEMARAAQLQELADFVDAHTVDGAPVVVGGDFNVEDTSPAHKLLARMFHLRDAHDDYVASHPDLDEIQQHGFTYDTDRNSNTRSARNKEKPCRIDYLWVNAKAAVSKIGLAFDDEDVDGHRSDHFGVAADLVLDGG